MQHNEVDAFATVLVKTSPLTSEDVHDLREIFNSFSAHGAGRKELVVDAKRAVRLLRMFGLRHAVVVDNGVQVQEGDHPKIMVNEQEFLLIAARLMRQEYQLMLENDYDLPPEKISRLYAERLFRSYDPTESGRIHSADIRDILINIGCKNVNCEPVCEYLTALERFMDLDSEVSSFVTKEEFVNFLFPLVLPTINYRLASNSKTPM